MKEVSLGRYAGPYSSPPFENYIQSPIGLVPKSNGDTRLIFHLLYPRTGKSVNTETPTELCTVRYPGFSDAIRMCMEEIEQYGSCMIAKSDMMSTFRNLGIKPEQFWFLVMKARSPWDNQWYYFADKCLPFRASISCSHFQRVSNAIAFLTDKINQKKPINYLDDYLFSAYLRTLCNAHVQSFLDLCESIKFPVSIEKTFWASTMLTFLGLLIDTVNQFISIPIDKVQRAIGLTEDILSGKKTTVHKMQKLCGFLNFLCRCIVPGRAFTRRLYSRFNTQMKPHYHINVNRELRSDLTVWMKFLAEPTVYCRPFIDFSQVLSAKLLDWYTDASGVIGCGGVCQGMRWFQMEWPAKFIVHFCPSIEYLELYAVTVSMLLWVRLYCNSRICIFCDNESVVKMLNNNTSSCHNCMILIRLIVLECLTWNIRLFAKHVRTKMNGLADSLSRFQNKRFRKLALEQGKIFSDVSCEIPKELLPMERIWLKS